MFTGELASASVPERYLAALSGEGSLELLFRENDEESYNEKKHELSCIVQ